jgi:hypothetical protein
LSSKDKVVEEYEEKFIQIREAVMSENRENEQTIEYLRNGLAASEQNENSLCQRIDELVDQNTELSA